MPLPPGTAIYVQGLVFDAGNTLRSSNSVRALWPAPRPRASPQHGPKSPAAAAR